MNILLNKLCGVFSILTHGIILTTILGTCFISEAARSNALVARQDFNANLEWKQPKVMGKSFWNVFHIDGDIYLGNFCDILKSRKIYKESARSCSINILNKESNTVSISEIFQSSWLRYKINHGLLFKDAFDQFNNSNAPLFLIGGDDVRPPWGNPLGEHHFDFGGYVQWKKDHPNFMGFIQPEWDNECVLTGPWNTSIRTWGNNNLTPAQIEKAIKEFPKPSTRTESLAMTKKMCGVLKKFYFNDTKKLGYLRASVSMDHYAYQWGAEITWLETTNTGAYRWQPAFFFTRGASHQYNKKWGWYLASFYNGYSADGGDLIGDTHVDYSKEYKESKKHYWVCSNCGMSLSLYTRGMYLAYLTGASFINHESPKKFVDKGNVLSPWGNALAEWFDFTQKNKRGINYVPVALLVPFEQGYPVSGGKSWYRYNYERPDWMIDAFMFTIVPFNPVTREGNEGCLSNGSYGDIYDVILPNTPEQPVALNILNKYKAAIMLGHYDRDKALANRLMDYVKEGGTLLINIKQLNEFFPTAFTGIERQILMENAGDLNDVDVKVPVRSLYDGKTFTLSVRYSMEAVKLMGALPLLADAEGKVVASSHDYGKGHVIVCNVDNMVPVHGIKTGAIGKKFPFIEYFLGRLSREVLPLEVNGDVEYGLNKLADGWLLYLINNKGITKFVDSAESVDSTKTAKIEVLLKIIKSARITELLSQTTIPISGRRFSIEVSPGDVKVIKIKTL